MPEKPVREPNPTHILITRFFIVFFTFLLPLAILLVGIVLIYTTTPPRKSISVAPLPSSVFTPDQVLAGRGAYSGRTITVNGRIFQESVVCENKACPPEDSCCGCPVERHLAIANADTMVTGKSLERLRLLPFSGKAYCERKPGSCTYECPEWSPGDIYNVTGIFHFEPPPPGWQLSLDYYFVVDKHQLSQKVTAETSLMTIFNDIKKQLTDLANSASYVLP